MAKPKDKHPWFKFFPANWRGNTELRLCSVGARGLWMEMLCIMHEAEPYGHLLNNGVSVTNKQLAQLAGVTLPEVQKFMCELELAGVYSRTEDKVIYSRKMVRDKAKSEQAKGWGSTGGNPELVGEDKGRVNPSDKGNDKPQKQKPNSTSKATAAAEAAELDEIGKKAEAALKAIFTALRIGKGWSLPNMDPVAAWLSEGIAQGTINSAVSPILKRKEDMASLAYCDGAVREAHAAVGHLRIVTSQVWVDEGTLEWAAHQSELHRTTGRGSPVTDQKDENGVRTGRRGWYFNSTWPEGFNDFGERIEPASEDAA